MNNRQIFKEVCENDFAFFCKQYLKVVEPETVFEWNWHLTELCHWCERVYYGTDGLQNLDIQIPPRMLKSVIVNVLFPCWIWTKKPSFKIISGSRSYDLSIKFNGKRRDLIQSPSYQALWPIEFKKTSETDFENIYNGKMKAVSALGKITGEGADLLLSDDLIDAMDSFSTTKREAVNTWFSNAFYNRAQNRKTVKRININQRLHAKDVSGHIAEFHNYKTLIFPMEMTENNMSTCGFKDPRKPGAFIHPSRFDAKEKADEYKSLGVYGWSSQYQQNPKPIGGGLIKEEWIRRFNPFSVQKFDRKIITADLTFKGNEDSDYVCFQCWGTVGTTKFLFDIVRGKWSYKITKEKFAAFCLKHVDATDKYIEDKANGPALISDMEETIYGMQPWPEKKSPLAKADKVQRLRLISQEYENGDVYIAEGIELANEFIEELTSFTEKGSATGNDDMVDTSTMALLELKTINEFFEG